MRLTGNKIIRLRVLTFVHRSLLFPSLSRSKGTIRDDTEFSENNFLSVRDFESCIPDGIRETVESEGSCRRRRQKWGGKVSRVRVFENGSECRRRAAGTAGFELLQILNISDHQSPSAWQYPKVLVLHLFLYRAPIYERHTSGSIAIIARSRSRQHLAICIIFHFLPLMMERFSINIFVSVVKNFSIIICVTFDFYYLSSWS